MQKVRAKINIFKYNTTFTIDGVMIAEIRQDISRPGRYSGAICVFGRRNTVCDNCDYIDAIECVSNNIDIMFKQIGLVVEFE